MRVTGLLLRGEEVKSRLDWVHCLGRLEVQIPLPTAMPTEEGIRARTTIEGPHANGLYGVGRAYDATAAML